MKSTEYINKVVKVKIDRKIGSKHPKYNYIYPINYGYVPGTITEDGEALVEFQERYFEHKLVR